MRTIHLLLPLLLAACAAPRVQTATAPRPCGQEGLASWYTAQPGHARTADGERLDPAALTAAHRSLPFGTRVRVTDLDSGRSVVVRITDRGPVAHDRIIDLSPAAAKALAMKHDGVAHVRLEMADAAAAPGVTEAVATAGTGCALPQTMRS